MPTGYTAHVANGDITSLEAFALRCARGMGATIMMRDEPFDAPIPERFEPSDFHVLRLASAKVAMADLLALNDAQKAEKAADWNREHHAYRKKRVSDKEEIRARYEAMIAKVEAWENSPEGIKEFMLEQLRTGLDFDCPADPLKYVEPLRTVTECYDEAIRKTAWYINYHTSENDNEIKRIKERNAWLVQLRASLSEPSHV